MKLILSKSDLLPTCDSVSLYDVTLECFAVPARILKLAEDIEYVHAPGVSVVLKDKDGAY